MKQKLLPALVASMLVGMPLAASEAAAYARTSQPISGKSSLAADSNLFFFGGIALVAAAIILLQEDEEGAPISA